MVTVCLILVTLLTAACAEYRIVGGSKANDGQFPYQVSLRSGNWYYCGGAIFHNQWVLTAGHCVQSFEGLEKKILVGTNNVNGKKDIYKVVKEIVHENFTNNFNDIALLKVDRPIKFSDKVQPIGLQTEDIPSGEDLVLSGWGKLSANGGFPKWLQYINLTSISNSECAEKWGYIDKSQMCTFTKVGEGACLGDSGSPLVYKGKLAGIVSYGSPCAVGMPDVYTRVSEFITWIHKNIASNL